VKFPRDLSGVEFAKLLRLYGYEQIRQSGSHIRVRSMSKGAEHQVTIPAHTPLKVGTLSGILLENRQLFRNQQRSARTGAVRLRLRREMHIKNSS
jgi:predicted RNA binding protein YcfA (HicA-like mRNA interferase family)